MTISKAACLELVAKTCEAAADLLRDPTIESEHTFKQICPAAGKVGFSFKDVMLIDGQEIEIQVRCLDLEGPK